MMGITRLTDTSMNYFLRQELSLQITGGETTTSNQIVYMLEHQNVVPTKSVMVYRNGEEVDRSEYDFYPIEGKIEFKELQESTDTISADYYYTWVGIADSYVDDILRPPFVAIENPGDMSIPYELGSTSEWVSSEFFIHVYGRSEGQRDDISDLIRDAFHKDCPIWNFNNGFPTLYGGKLNFDWDPSDVIGYILFETPRIRRNPLQSNDELERGRALITVEVNYYRP